MITVKRLAFAIGALGVAAAACSAGVSVGPGAARQQQPSGAVASYQQAPPAPAAPAAPAAAAREDTIPKTVTITVPQQPGAEPKVEAEIQSD
jgi:hypothetical protein